MVKKRAGILAKRVVEGPPKPRSINNSVGSTDLDISTLSTLKLNVIRILEIHICHSKFLLNTRSRTRMRKSSFGLSFLGYKVIKNCQNLDSGHLTTTKILQSCLIGTSEFLFSNFGGNRLVWWGYVNKLRWHDYSFQSFRFDIEIVSNFGTR